MFLQCKTWQHDDSDFHYDSSLNDIRDAIRNSQHVFTVLYWVFKRRRYDVSIFQSTSWVKHNGSRELLVLLQGPFKLLISFNTMSHCLISLAVSECSCIIVPDCSEIEETKKYSNCSLNFIIKKVQNLQIKVTPSGTSEGNMMTRVPTTKDI